MKVTYDRLNFRDYLFDSVLDEIFISILHVFKEEFLKRQAKGEHNSDVMETEEVGLKVF